MGGVSIANGAAVVIDAAAGFDSLVPSALPSVVILHATKVLGRGEGGFVISTDPAMRRAVRTRANFVFDGSREAQAVAFNARMGRDSCRMERCGQRLSLYSRERSNQICLQHGFGETSISSTCLLSFVHPAADRVERSLTLAVSRREDVGSGSALTTGHRVAPSHRSTSDRRACSLDLSGGVLSRYRRRRN